MAEYHLITIWHIGAPLERVFAAIRDSLGWPAWWPGAKKVEQTAAGDRDGINSVRRYVWRGILPYTLVFEVRATHIEKLVAIEGIARGDLEGSGRWHFSRDGNDSIVHYEWHVHSTKWWMNLVAPFARSIFIRNHVRIMTQGGEGLAHLLNASLQSQENIDLMQKGTAPASSLQQLRQAGWINPRLLPMVLLVLMVALFSGTVATLAQMLLWWLADIPVFQTLLRDARLTAALVMGPSVLAPATTAQWDILLVATLIHGALSVVYALLPAMLLDRLSGGLALVAGAFYGLMIYWVNLHGLTLVFPWFAVTRDWITLTAHLVFGIALVGAYRFFGGESHYETQWKSALISDCRD